MPRLVVEHATQPERRSVLVEPLRTARRADVDRVARHVAGVARSGDPAEGFLERSVAGDRLVEQTLLVALAPPTTGDDQRDPLALRLLPGGCDRLGELGPQLADQRARTEGLGGASSTAGRRTSL